MEWKVSGRDTGAWFYINGVTCLISGARLCPLEGEVGRTLRIPHFLTSKQEMGRPLHSKQAESEIWLLCCSTGSKLKHKLCFSF
jgi:hypothetical protein